MVLAQSSEAEEKDKVIQEIIGGVVASVATAVFPLGVPADINLALSKTLPYVTRPSKESEELGMTTEPRRLGLDEVLKEGCRRTQAEMEEEAAPFRECPKTYIGLIGRVESEPHQVIVTVA